MDDDIQPSDEPCPKCGLDTVTRPCSEIGCEDGMLNRYDEDPGWYSNAFDQVCPECVGNGYHHWCQHCGWDILEKRYLNGWATVYFPAAWSEEQVSEWAHRHGSISLRNEKEAVLFDVS